MALPNLRNIVSASSSGDHSSVRLTEIPQFASFRTPQEERQWSQTAFYKFIGYVCVTLVFSLVANKSVKSAKLLGPS